MFRLFGKRLGTPSTSSATRRTYRPAFDTLEERAVPAVDAFIWFESHAISHSRGSGESHTTTHGAFEIKDFSFGVENPTTIGSATAGAGGGKAKFNEFQITTTLDSASAAFFKSCVAGAHYDTVILEMRKAGGDPTHPGTAFLKYTFHTVFVTKIDWSGPGDESPTEAITFVYGRR
jgi:type VI secretion system secreted protein Hcp